LLLSPALPADRYPSDAIPHRMQKDRTMIIGVPREVKTDEYRVGMRPAGVELLTQRGNRVLVERSAGEGSGLLNDAYAAAGAEIVESAAEVWGRAEMIVKVKEPLPAEWPMMREGQVVFTYFHFAADAALTRACLDRKIIAIAYETLEEEVGGRPTLPLLTPMSEIAGRMAAQEGAKYLERPWGGRGVLLGGVPGVETGKVLVIGGGVVGINAATIAYGMGARVVVIEKDIDRMRMIGASMPRQLITVYSDPEALREYLAWADVVIGAVLVPGAAAPRLIKREHLKLMQPGSVIVDVAIDQGGCAETSRVTTHRDPVYIVDDVVHYCVGNMPGAVARTSTWALTNATMPWTIRLASEGWHTIAQSNHGFRKAIEMDQGRLINPGVAQAHGMRAEPF
jgi:alanine dehydrogenase